VLGCLGTESQIFILFSLVSTNLRYRIANDILHKQSLQVYYAFFLLLETNIFNAKINKFSKKHDGDQDCTETDRGEGTVYRLN